MSGNDLPLPATHAQSRDASWSWRQKLLMTSAILLVGGVLLVRFLAPLHPEAQAVDLLADLGAELPGRPLSQTETSLALEPPPEQRTGPQRLAEHVDSGDLILLHFWASWCPPCITELPELLSLANAMKGRKFRLLAVSYDDDWPAQDEVLRRTVGSSRPTNAIWLRDTEGQDGDPTKMLRTRLGTDQLPETYVIVGGKVLARFISSQPWTSPRMLRMFEVLTSPR
jgi:thiol-disulfide isomerase/thioredoxin